MKEIRSAYRATAGLVIALLLASCGDSPERKARRAVDGLINQATTAEDRAALERARDEANAEMREQMRALDEEIRRLRRENAALEKELAEASSIPP